MLARGHARSGDAIALSGYIGTSDRFIEAVAEFAVDYADQTEADYKTFHAFALRATRRAQEWATGEEPVKCQVAKSQGDQGIGSSQEESKGEFCGDWMLTERTADPSASLLMTRCGRAQV